MFKVLLCAISKLFPLSLPTLILPFQRVAETSGKYFWDNPPEDWDEINNVGLR